MQAGLRFRHQHESDAIPTHSCLEARLIMKSTTITSKQHVNGVKGAGP